MQQLPVVLFYQSELPSVEGISRRDVCSLSKIIELDGILNTFEKQQYLFP